MADETVWIDLDEVESAAKTIMGLLKELEGPANRLEAKVKQVEDSVYGTDLVGKALQGAGSSVGGLGKHQEQVLAGIRTLIQNATAMGQNLQAMAARHRANDEQHGAEIGRISADGDMPADPRLPGNLSAPVGTVPASLPGVPDEPSVDPRPTPPPPPAPVAPIGDTDTDTDYHRPDAPTLDYNHHDEVVEALRGGGGGGSRQLI
ncbi:WXG100 family type VII secretion target [Kitasatospora sp. NPDC059646]|uniref:WXG100 family type VII secretion target n=1 Tax=Kitasatospora sp. NPDC059646 TaxID=3346893 RepID=UPI0036C67C6B